MVRHRPNGEATAADLRGRMAAINVAESCIARHPGRFLAVAALLGVLLGWWIKRKQKNPRRLLPREAIGRRCLSAWRPFWLARDSSYRKVLACKLVTNLVEVVIRGSTLYR